MRIRNEYSLSEEIMDEEIEYLATISDALAHPARIRMLRFIMDRNKEREPVCNKDIVAEFGYAQSTVSQHLKTLVSSGLVETRTVNRRVDYFVNIGNITRYGNIAKKLYVSG